MLQKDVSNTDFHQAMRANKGVYSSEYASIIPSYSTDSDESLYKDDIMDFENNSPSSRCSQSSITCTPIPVHLSPCRLYSGKTCQRNGRSMQHGLDKITERETLDQDVLNIGESKTPSYKSRLVLGISQKYSFPKVTTSQELHTDNNDEIYKTPKEFLTSSANNTNFEVSTPNVTYKQIKCNSTITSNGPVESNLTSYVDSLFGAEPASYIHDHQPLTLFWLPNSEISGLMRIPSLSCFQNSTEYSNSEKLYLTFTQYSVDIIQDVSEFKAFPFVPNHTPFIVIYSYSFKSMYFKVVPRSVNQTKKVKLTKNGGQTCLNGHTDAIDLSIDHDSSDANYVFYRSYLFGKDDNIDPNRLKILVQRSNKINFDMRCLSVSSNRVDLNEGPSSNGVKKRKREEYIDEGFKQDCSTDSESCVSSESSSSSVSGDAESCNDSEIPDVLLTECKLLIGTEINDNIDGCNMSIANYRSESVIKKNFSLYLVNNNLPSGGEDFSKRVSIGPLVKANEGKVLYHANGLELSEGDSIDIKFPTIYTKHFEHDRVTLFSDKVLKTCFNYMKSLAQENDLVITINNIAQFCPNIFWNLSLCGDIKTAIMELDPELLKSLYKRKRNKLVSNHDELHDNKKSLGYLDNNFIIMQDLFKRDADEKVRKLLEIEERNRANGKVVRITLNKHADDELIISTVMDDNGFIKKSMQLLTEKQKNVVYKECMKRNFYVPVHIKFTPEKGRGVYAAYKINKDDFVMEYKGELVTEKVAKFRNQKYNKSTSYKGSFIFFFKYNGRRYGIDATEEDISFGPARLVNHSRKNPNIVPRTILSNNYPRLIFVAKRNIDWGEELLVDYGERDPEIIKENPWLLE